jgi:thiol-disulfide isomerase/thioredoxin
VTAKSEAVDKGRFEPSSPQGPVARAIETTSKAAPRETSASVVSLPKPTAVDADALLKQADLAIKNRDLEGGLKKLDEALAVDSNHRRALVLQATLLQDQAQRDKQPNQAHQNDLFLKSAVAARRLRTAHLDLNQPEKALLATVFYNEACAYARVNNSEKAIASLGEAIDAGFSNLKLLDSDSDLVSLRNESAFRNLKQRVVQLAAVQLRTWAKKAMADQKPFKFTFRRPDVRSTKLVPLSDYQGKVLVVDLWATWCPPCREQIPELVKLHKAYRSRGLEVVGINFEGTPFKEARTTVGDFARKNSISYTCLLGDVKTRDQVPNFVGYPTLLFFDRTGAMRLVRPGYQPYEILEAIATSLLEEPVSTVAKKS